MKNFFLENLENLKVFLNIQILWGISIKIIEECNLSRKCNILVIFDDMIADMISNKKLNQV